MRFKEEQKIKGINRKKIQNIWKKKDYQRKFVINVLRERKTWSYEGEEDVHSGLESEQARRRYARPLPGESPCSIHAYASRWPITVIAEIFARSNAGIVGSNSTQGIDVCVCVCVYSVCM
jgi:hypothetical protein